MKVMDTIDQQVLPALRGSFNALEMQTRELLDSAQIEDLGRLVRSRPVAALGLAAVIGVLLGRITPGR